MAHPDILFTKPLMRIVSNTEWYKYS